MTLVQIEERLLALEKVIEAIRARQEPQDEVPAGIDEDFIPDAEYPVALDVPPHEEFVLRGKIVSIELGLPELGLSEGEWAGFGLREEEDLQ